MSDIKAMPYNDGTESPADQASRTLSQLRALTASFQGPGFAPFNSLNDNLRHDYLWLIDGLVDQLGALLPLIIEQGRGHEHA